MKQPLYVHAVALWSPEYPDAAAWLAGRSQPTAEPAAELLPKRMRGRASLLTAMLAEVVGRAAGEGGADLERLPLIVGSAFGEMATTVQLLRMMNSADGALSPARFQASVHNAAAGQISITTLNPSFSSCLAAGDATCAAALLEAYALLAAHDAPGSDTGARAAGEVMVAVADEALPEFFARDERFGALAVALLLRASAGTNALARLEPPLHAAEPVSSSQPSVGSAEYAGHPAAPLLDLMRAVLERRPAEVELPLAPGRLRIQVAPCDRAVPA